MDQLIYYINDAFLNVSATGSDFPYPEYQPAVDKIAAYQGKLILVIKCQIIQTLSPQPVLKKVPVYQRKTQILCVYLCVCTRTQCMCERERERARARTRMRLVISVVGGILERSRISPFQILLSII